MVPTAVLTLGILQRHRGRSDPIDVGNPFVVYCCYKRRCRSSKCLAHPSGLCRLFFFKRGSCFQFQVNLVDLMDLLCCTSRCVECAKGGQ